MSEVAIPAGRVRLAGDLQLPRTAGGVVVFSHGSGSGRHSPRNRYVAGELRRAGFGTLLLDLLTVEEDRDYEARFDIDLLARRLTAAVSFVAPHGLPIALFGASTGAASALRVAAAMPEAIAAVVSRGGRPDLAGHAALAAVVAPTLLLVGAEDHEVIKLNEEALERMQCEREMVLVPGATHLFEEPGTLEEVARLAAEWLGKWLASRAGPRRPPAAPL